MTTTKAEHTPGPWIVLKNAGLTFVAKEGIQGGSCNIAVVHGAEDEEGAAFNANVWGVVLDEDANARLIAAAPELLDLLQEIAANRVMASDGLVELRDRMRVAIRAATEAPA